jgi:RNA polymerase sigma-70 factor (ECF subfamily)
MTGHDLDPATDLDLWVRQAVRGDADAYSRLIEHFAGHLYQIAYYQLASADDALDACQEAVLSAWQAAAGFEGCADDFRRWLTRITVNACRDRRRYEARRPRGPLEVERDGTRFEIPLPDSGQSPESYAETQDLGRLLEACLARLTDEHRTVILLDHAGYDYREMAEILSVEVGTVKSRLSRARAHMRDLLLARGGARGTPPVDVDARAAGAGEAAPDGRSA